MQLDLLLKALYDTPLATAMRENEALFPWVEALHVIALTLVLGSIAVLDLKLIGVSSTKRPLASVLRDVLAPTWLGFGVAVATGLAMFSSNAVAYAHNACFQSKMLLLAGLGLNTALFHLWLAPRIERAPPGATLPWQARLSGIASIALWIAVTALGRWIGFTITLVQ
jgi:hypothetical protein